MQKLALVEQLPIFVYGTLLPGHPNFTRMFGEDAYGGAVAVEHEVAWVDNHALLANSESYYPYLCHTDDIPEAYRPKTERMVHGSVLWFESKDWPRVIERLDRLEGVPDHYTRVKVQAHCGGHVTTAWVYCLSRENTEAMFRSPLCEDNSWADHVRKHKTYKIEE